MKLQNPTTKETITTRAYSETAKRLLNEGWKDVTPERSHSQVDQAHRFIAMGMLARTDTNLLQCKVLCKFTAKEITMIDQVKSILWAKSKQLRGGGLTST